jgi:glycosyltransferase involved in cell wall biosynthesis
MLSFPYTTFNSSKNRATRPLFSIITAVLNNGSEINKVLESVGSQTFGDLEHIVIDGGSADATPHILKQYESKFRLRWLSEPDSGIAEAMNKGVHMAAGVYSIFIHSDDTFIDSTVLETVAIDLVTEQYDICCFPILFKHPRKGIIKSSPIKLPWYHRFRNTIRHQGCFVHRRLHERIGGYNHRFSIVMDYDFFYRALQARASIQYFSRPLALMGGEGVSSDPRFLLKRLQEEQAVQDLNEQNHHWRVAQRMFRRLYIPYKTRWLSRELRRPQA